MGEMRWRRNDTLRLASVCLGVGWACAPGQVEPVAGPRTQRIVLDGTRLAALSVTGIDRVNLTVSGPGMPAVSTPLGRGVDGTWSVSVNGIPAGPARIFEALAFDASGTLAYAGQTVADILPGSAIQLFLLLQGSAVVVEPGVPRVSSFEVTPGQVAAASSVGLRVIADGPAGDRLSFAWDAACDGTTDHGSFVDSTAAVTRWIAPASQPVVCTISVRVGSTQGSSVTVYVPVQVAD